MTLQAPMPCPQCGEYDLYRSRSRNIAEKIIKKLLPYKTYRCHNCNWRGWINKHKMGGKKFLMKTILFYAIIFIITLIVAYLLQLLIL